MFKDSAEILCDDRIIVRKWHEGWKIHGTWSHGDLQLVSPGSALLKAIVFLEKADVSSLLPLQNGKETIKRILDCTIRSFVDKEWLEKTLPLVEEMGKTIPCHLLRFDQKNSPAILMERLTMDKKMSVKF
jgi:hypothetical protein